jgi:hypothetical protein
MTLTVSFRVIHLRVHSVPHPTQDSLGLPVTGSTYDLAIIRGPTKIDNGMLDQIRALRKPCGFLLRVLEEMDASASGTGSGSGTQTPLSGRAFSTLPEDSGFLVYVSSEEHSADETREMANSGESAAWLNISLQ